MVVGGRESTTGGWEEREREGTLQGAGTGIVGTAMPAMAILELYCHPPARETGNIGLSPHRYMEI